MHLSVVQKLSVYIIPLILAITIHEIAHAFIAKKRGDNTAQMMGRLSLNPIHHIDLIGTILFPLIGLLLGGVIFGWAKPVPINYRNLRNPKQDLFFVSLAGPFSNLLMALLWALILKLSYYFNNYFGLPLNLMSQAGISINISLMILNLLPILPLDGGRMLYALLPEEYAKKYGETERYGLIILFLLLLIGGLTYIISPIYNFLVNFILNLI